MAKDCPHCDREFPSSRALEDHVDRAHPDADDPTEWTPIILGALLVLAGGAVAAAIVLGGGPGSGGLHIEDSPRTGDDDAPVQMIAFESPACTSCRLFHIARDGQVSTFEQILDEFVETGDVLYVEKFARAGYGWDRVGANAQRCAWELGGWPAFQSLTQGYYEQRRSIDGSNAAQFAVDWASGSNHVNAGDFQSCFEDNRYDDKLGRDLADGSMIGVSGTPTFIIRTPDGNVSRQIVGPQPYSTFANAIDAVLAQAGANTTAAQSDA